MPAVDLSTEYLGIHLRNPLVVAASPLGAFVTTLQQLEAAGAGAVVLPSLFEEQIKRDISSSITKTIQQGPAPGLKSSTPHMSDYNAGPDSYLKQLELARKSLSIPVIASLNGSTKGGWVKFASLMEQAGAQAIELNIYFVPTDLETTGADVEQRCLDIAMAVREAVSIPVAVKLGPYFASFPNLAWRFSQIGVQGLVMFNRFLEPEFDIDAFSIRPQLELSQPRELRLVLRWIGILHKRLPLSLAATSGIHNAEDVIKALLAGADVTMMASTLIQHGPSHLEKILSGLQQWMKQKKYSSVADFRGLLSRHTYGKPADFERANYMEAISTFTKNFQ